MKLKIDFKGVKKVKTKFDNANKNINSNIDKYVESGAKKATKRLKLLCPVKTGKLSRSITLKQLNKGKYGISIGVKYWMFVEFGTKKMAAKPFIRIGIDSSKNNVKKTIEEGVISGIRRINL